MSNPSGANQVLTKTYETDPNANRVIEVGSFAAPSDTDAITVAYPTLTTEVYSFKSGGVSGTLLMTITVIYTTSSKEFISSVVKT